MDRHYHLVTFFGRDGQALSPSHNCWSRWAGTISWSYTGCLKKTSFCENGAWQILLLIMRNQPSFFLTNAADDTFCNSFVYHLVGLEVVSIQHQAWKMTSQFETIHHRYPYIYLTSERALVFYLYLQKFNMDFSLPVVIFAMANFHKRKFFLGTL